MENENATLLACPPGTSNDPDGEGNPGNVNFSFGRELKEIQGSNKESVCYDNCLKGFLSYCNQSEAGEGNQPEAGEGNQRGDDAERNLREKLGIYMNPFKMFKKCKCCSNVCIKIWQIVTIFLQFLALCFIILKGSSSIKNDAHWAKFVVGNQETIRMLFLGGESLTLYTLDDLYAMLSHAATVYYNLQETSIGPYDYLKNYTHENLVVTGEFYKEVTFDPVNFKVSILKEPVPFNFTLLPTVNDTCLTNCSYESQIRNYINGTSIIRLKKANVIFSLTAFYFNDLDSEFNFVYCVEFKINIAIENKDERSNIPVDLDISGKIIGSCDPDAFKDHMTFTTNVHTKYWYEIGTLLVISIFTLWIIFAGSCVYLKILKDFNDFLKKYFNRKLAWKPILALADKWLLLLFCGNILIIAGGAINIQFLLQTEVNLTLENQVRANILFGIGLLLHGSALLKIFGYVKSFNILLLTLSHSLPTILRLSAGAIVLFGAFLFWGCLVLGPYVDKFSDPITAAFGLFSILNGEEFFTTYTTVSNSVTPYLVATFGKLYLLTFVVIFVFVVLEVVVAIVTNVYEQVRTETIAPSSKFLKNFEDNSEEWKKWKSRYIIRRQVPTSESQA